MKHFHVPYVRGKNADKFATVVDVHEVPDLQTMEPPPSNVGVKQQQCADLGLPGAGDKYSCNPKTFFLDTLASVEALDKRHHEGWKNGADRAMKLCEGLMDEIASPLSIRRRIRWGDEGDEFCKERMMDGHLDSAWRGTSRQIAVANPIIHIVTPVGGNAGRVHEELFWSGAAALALCTTLEEAGFQTKLTAISSCRYGSEDSDGDLPGGTYHPHLQNVVINVKEPGEYIRPDAVASIICLGATFRTYVFYAYTCAPRPTDSGLGTTSLIDRSIPWLVEQGAIEVPQIILPDTYDEATAKKAVNDALKELHAANLAGLPDELIENL